MSRTRCQMASSSSTTGTRSPAIAYAALFTRMSTDPSSETVFSTMPRVWAGSPRSATMVKARRPIARISSATLSMSRHPIAFSSSGNVSGERPVPVTATSAPVWASARAVSRPMPR